MRLRHISTTFFLLIISLFLLTAMGKCSSRDTNGDTDKESVSPFEIEDLLIREAPDFSANDIDGKVISLSELRGKVVLLNFWATWCPPCKSEMPSLDSLFREMESHGLEIIAISTDNSSEDVREYLSKNSFDFRIVWDKGRIITKKYRVFSIPVTFLIDRNGFIVEIFMGEYDWTAPKIKEKIRKL